MCIYICIYIYLNVSYPSHETHTSLSSEGETTNRYIKHVLCSITSIYNNLHVYYLFYACAHVYIHMHVRTRIDIIHICVCIYICMHASTRLNAHIHRYIHTYILGGKNVVKWLYLPTIHSEDSWWNHFFNTSSCFNVCHTIREFFIRIFYKKHDIQLTNIKFQWFVNLLIKMFLNHIYLWFFFCAYRTFQF